MDHLRDAVLAAASGSVLLATLAASDSIGSLSDPTAAVAGVAAALAVEGLFVADTPAASLWERRRVRVASAAALLGGCAALAWVTGTWILAAACWGLATYFALLALVLTGVWDADGTERADGD